MDWFLLLKALYMINGFIAVLMYLPQIISLKKNRTAASSVSLLTFGGWTIGCAVTVLYAWLCVKDPIFTVIGLGNLTGCGIIFVLTALKRFNAAKHESAAPS